MSEGKVVSRKLVVALGIIIIILAGALAGSFVYNNSLLNSKDAQITNLQNQAKELQDEINTLEALKSQLQAWLSGNKTALEQVREWLSKNKTYYEGKVAELQKQITELQKQVEVLQVWLNGNKTLLILTQQWLNGNKTYYEGKIAELQKQITELQKQVSDLQNQVASLQKQVKDLQNQVNELLSIVDLKVTKTLEKDKTINLPPGGNITLSYPMDYAGYITITFTASGTTVFAIGSDSTNPTWYFWWVSDGTLTSCKIPVTRGTTYIGFANPSSFSGLTVTFTLEYTY